MVGCFGSGGQVADPAFGTMGSQRVSHHSESTVKGINLKGLRRLKALIAEQCTVKGKFKNDVFLVEHQGKFEEREREFTFDGQNSYEEFRFRRLRVEGTTDFRKLTINQAVETWVKDSRQTPGRCRLLDNPKVVDPMDVGRPTYYVSCPWRSSVAKFFETLEGFLALANNASNSSDTTYVWVDWLAINPHQDGVHHKDDVAAFNDTLQVCKQGTLAIVDMARINPFARAWTLYEWTWTMFLHGPTKVQFLGMDANDLENAMEQVDVIETATCFSTKEREAIFEEIKRHHGSIGEFKSKVRRCLPGASVAPQAPNVYHHKPMPSPAPMTSGGSGMASPPTSGVDLPRGSRNGMMSPGSVNGESSHRNDVDTPAYESERID